MLGGVRKGRIEGNPHTNSDKSHYKHRDCRGNDALTTVVIGLAATGIPGFGDGHGRSFPSRAEWRLDLEKGAALAEAGSRTEAAAVDNAGGVAARVPQPTRHGWDGIQPATVRQRLLAGHFSGWLVGESKRCCFLTDLENND